MRALNTKSIVGLLNKVSPKNIDLLLPRIVETAVAQGVSKSVSAIVRHCLKQPTYMSMFVRALGDIASTTATARDDVVASIDAVVREHLSGPSLTATLPPDASQNDAYDEFCVRVKAVKTLNATVALVAKVVRAHLCEAVDISGYAAFLVHELSTKDCTADVEVMLGVLETFVAGAGSTPSGFRKGLEAWAASHGRDNLTSRGRFILMAVLQRA
jgi:hypothetical protein